MAKPTSRTEFKAYCLRRLGDGAIKINVTDAQVEDRIDDALEYYADYHFAGNETVFFKHVVTQVDIDNEFISVPENIIGLVELFDPSAFGSSASDLFDFEFQTFQNEVNGLNDFSATNIFFRNYAIQSIQNTISVIPRFRYNRHVNKLFIDTNWEKEFEVGKIVLVRAHQVVDPDVFTDVWKDIWLSRYTTALIKRQWGSNLSKFSAIQLPGGVTFDALKIYDDAIEEIRIMEDEMIDKFRLPVIGVLG